jgi:methyl-accepting chemotaxis protein
MPTQIWLKGPLMPLIERIRLRSMGARLIAGFGATILALVLVAAVGVWTLGRLAADARRELGAVTVIGRRLSEVNESTVRMVTTAQELALTGGQSGERMDLLTLAADSLRRALIAEPALPEDDRIDLEEVGGVQGRLQVYLAVAQAYRDVGRDAASRIQAELAARALDTLRLELESLLARQSDRADLALDRVSGLARGRQRVLIAFVLLGVLLAGGVAWITWNATIRPLRVLGDTVERLGRGDLTVGIDAEVLDKEFAVVARTVGDTVRQLREIVLDIQREMRVVTEGAEALTAASSQAAQTSGQISTVVADIAREAEGQRQHVEESRRTVQQLTAGAGQLAAMAENSRGAGTDIAGTVASSREGVGRAAEALERTQAVIGRSTGDLAELERVASSVEGFLVTINWVADQTNLLALNAAIEAARAGDRGRGFAVVADEVKTLANTSGDAARRVRRVVADMKERVSTAVGGFQTGTEGLGDVGTTSAGMTRALDAIARSVERVERVGQALGEAALANRRAADELLDRLQAIGTQAEAQAAASQQAAAAAEQGAATAEEVSAIAANLKDGATRLQASVGRLVVRE